MDATPSLEYKDAKKYAAKLDLQLWLNLPYPAAVADGKDVEAKNSS